MKSIPENKHLKAVVSERLFGLDVSALDHVIDSIVAFSMGRMMRGLSSLHREGRLDMWEKFENEGDREAERIALAIRMLVSG